MARYDWDWCGCAGQGGGYAVPQTLKDNENRSSVFNTLSYPLSISLMQTFYR